MKFNRYEISSKIHNDGIIISVVALSTSSAWGKYSLQHASAVGFNLPAQADYLIKKVGEVML